MTVLFRRYSFLFVGILVSGSLAVLLLGFPSSRLLLSQWIPGMLGPADDGIEHASYARARLLPSSSRNSSNPDSIAGVPASRYRFDETVAELLELEPKNPPLTVPTRTASEGNVAGVVHQLIGRFEHNSRKTLANLFSYQDVFIKGNYRVSSKDVLEATGISSGGIFLGLWPSEIEARVEELSWVEKAYVRPKVYPLGVSVRLEEASPWIVARYESHSWLVSTKGELLEPLDSITDPQLIVESSRLPRLVGLEQQRKAESALSSPNARFRYAVASLKFLEMAGELPFALEQIRLLRYGGLELAPSEISRYPLVLVSVRSLDQGINALSRLKAVMADLKARGEKARRLDLRFENQVLAK